MASSGVAEEVFAELVALYLCPQRLGEQASAAAVSAGGGGGGGGWSAEWVRVAVHFFLSVVVQGRLRVQLAPFSPSSSSGSPASRRLMRAVDTCCTLWPGEAVALVLAPCVLPAPCPCPASSSSSSSYSSKHLYDLVTRVLRQVSEWLSD